MIPQPAPIVPITEQLPQLVKGLLGVAAEQAPGLAEPVDGGGLESAQHRELAVKVVQLVELLGQLDEVGHCVRSGARVLILQDFLQSQQKKVAGHLLIRITNGETNIFDQQSANPDSLTKLESC